MCLVVLYLVMPCLIDIPGRPVLSEGKGGRVDLGERGKGVRENGRSGGETAIKIY